MSKETSLGGKMLGQKTRITKWMTHSVNDNAPTRTVRGEGVVQCLHFLASELEHLAFGASALNVLHAAVVLQAELDADRHRQLVSLGAKGVTERNASPTAMVPGG